MTGMTDLFAIGASGVSAYRAAMGAVSENVANATTTGYNRRSVDLQESSSSAATSQFNMPGVAYGGVQVASVVRSVDPYLDQAARLANANYQNANTQATWLTNTQTALDDGDLGVGTLLGNMYSSVEKLSANPSDTTLRQNVLYSFEQVNTAFKQTYNDLQTVQAGVASTATNEVVSLNTALTQLASTNKELLAAAPGSSNQAQLLDQRDQALNDITQRADVSVSYDNNGVANITYAGTDLVKGSIAHTVGVTSNTDGTLAFTIDGTATTTPQNGSLAGFASSASVVADRITSLNTLASQYASDVNGWQEGGFTASGTAGTAMVTIGADASTLSMAISDPAQIAGASADGTTNGNLLAITNIRGANGVENGWAQLISTHANLLNSVKAQQTATSARNDQAQTARADVSGVDLDREASDLLRLQEAYQGSARVVQVAKECIDTIFQTMG